MPFIISRSVLFPLIALQLFSLEIAHANSIGEKKQIESSDSTSSLRDKGMGFTENKGQIADREGNLRPDVLYSTDACLPSPGQSYGRQGAGAAIYIRKTGISYVFSDADKIMEEIHEQVEQASHDPNELSDKSPEELEHELLSLARIKTHQVNVDFEGANTNVHTEHEYELQGFNNYYYAHCPDGITHVKQYQEIRQKNIYDGIDVVYYGGQTGLKYDIVVNPGGNSEDIKLKYTGQDKLTIDNGQLTIETSLGELAEWMPKVYQNINGKIVDVEAEYVLEGTTISFKLNTYNLQLPLIIDPWVTYYGGTQWDRGNAVATDAQGNVYMGGETESTTAIASPGAHQAAFGGGVLDAFLVKFDANGNRLWATYYGGAGIEYGNAVATDAQGNVYMGGYTASTTAIASPGAYQAALGGNYDAFLVKFDVNGKRLWATYYGGKPFDKGSALATDAQGNIYMGGQTISNSAIASPGTHQAALGGNYDAFLVKFESNGNRSWATYYGGAEIEYGNAVATDAQGNVYMGGETQSTTAIASPGAHQAAYGGGGASDAFLVKFDVNGNRLWATYYGGAQWDHGYAVATDAQGNVYMGGYTASATAIASPGAYQAALGGGLSSDAFLVKLDVNGKRLWATYLGGSKLDYAKGLAVDPLTDHVFISGDTYSINFPVSPCAFQSNLVGLENSFIARFYPNGNIFCSSYLGGNHEEDAVVALSGCYIYMAGYTPGGLPVTPGAYQTAYGGGNYDAFLVQLYKSTCGLQEPVVSVIPSQNNNTACSPCNGSATAQVSSTCVSNALYSYVWSTGLQLIDTNITSHTISGLCAGTYWVKVMSNCNQTDSISYTITGIGGGTAFTTTVSVCPGQSAMIHGQAESTPGVYTQTYTAVGGCDSISSVHLSLSPVSQNTITVAACASYTLNGQAYAASGLYTQTLVSAAGCDSILSLDLTIGNPINTSAPQSICSGQSATIHGSNQSTAGVYTQTFTAIGGCDSISTITLDVIPVSSNTITVSSCNSYTHNAQVYSSSGIYTQTLNNAAGCDSILSLDLTIGNPINTSATQSICSGQSAMIHGSNQSTAGVYTQTFTAIGGCDSISTITLDVNPVSSNTVTVSSCSSYTHNGQTYITSGMYTQTLNNAAGCDSILSIDLVINSTINTGSNQSICSGQSAMIHGQSESAPGVYTQTYTAIGGCDSISTITLDVISVSSNTITVSSCNSYTHNAQVYSSSGIYTQTLNNAAGCDSILSLDLTIGNPINTSATQSICSGQSALIFGINQTTSGIYTQTYAAANGCDSISSITLTIYPAVNAAFTASPQPATLLSPTINFINQSTGSVNYYWNFGDNTISSDVNPSHPYENTGHYQAVLIAENQYGCKDTAEQLIIIGDDFTFFIPNAFTPGNTEPNNSFNGRGIGINKYQLWIYDRWGNMIYTTGETASTEEAVPWDGRANGGKDIAQQDVYVWRVVLTDVFGRSHKYVGHVTLLR